MRGLPFATDQLPGFLTTILCVCACVLMVTGEGKKKEKSMAKLCMAVRFLSWVQLKLWDVSVSGSVRPPTSGMYDWTGREDDHTGYGPV